MKRLELWLPAKPFIVTQGQGIYNPAYQQFGFTKHNGFDFKLGHDSTLRCPVDNLYIYEVAYNDASGFYVKGNTLDSYLFEDGKQCHVNMFFLHLAEMSPVKVGQTLQVGDVIGIQGNTGFSTGPHTHWGCRRITADGTLVDSNDANNTFDQSKYFNGSHAEDKGIMLNIISLAKKVIELLQRSKPQP